MLHFVYLDQKITQGDNKIIFWSVLEYLGMELLINCGVWDVKAILFLKFFFFCFSMAQWHSGWWVNIQAKPVLLVIIVMKNQIF